MEYQTTHHIRNISSKEIYFVMMAGRVSLNFYRDSKIILEFPKMTFPTKYLFDLE